MSFVLRDYQVETVNKTVEFLLTSSDENGLVIIPTGGGKSLCIAETVIRLAAPAIIFQPSREILLQNLAKFQSFNHYPSVFSASVGEKRIGKITLATIGSVARKPELFRHVKYIIIDEAHESLNPRKEDGMFMRFLNELPDVRICGYTATPYRLRSDGFGGSILKFLTRTRPRVFHKVIHVVQNGDLFSQGYLCKLEYKEVKTGFNRARLRLNSTGADYTDESVRNHFAELHFSDQIVRCVNRVAELRRGPVLVFTRFVEEARYVASKIPGAAIVSADTPKKDRERIIEGFKAGRIPVVANCNVLGIGFDYPELANVILANPTRSLARYYQWVGRCIRPHPSKQSAYVIDMVGLVEKFGKVEDLRLVCGPHDTWFVESNGKQLTNKYLEGQSGRRYGAKSAGQVEPLPVTS